MKPKMWWYKRSSWPHLLARWMMLFANLGYILLPSAVVWANPSGEQVVGGAATFDRQGNTLTVNQATDRLAVNWQDFSIAAGETTHFNMPSAASIALNRVLGGNPSQIYGTLSSNGNIILVNNAGIFVGPGGVVNAASFVGSTLDIDPNQFMNAGQGGYHLHGDSYAPIVNQGNITAEKGDVFLIAQKVENRGTISAPNGRAALVGTGQKTEVVLHEVGGSGFAVRVAQLEGENAVGSNQSLPDGEELLNEGEIAAAQAELNASGNIYALAIKNTGTIRAKAVVAQADGTVRLDGGAGDVLNAGSLIAKNAGDISTAAGGKIEVTGQNVTASPESIITAAGGEMGGNGGKVKIDSADTTIVQGKVDVTAPSANAKGGKVELLGERVGLFDGAKVDASGGAGGGTVLAGGDYLGGRTPKPEFKDLAKQESVPVKNAKATVMANTAEIRADATASGDGGKVILWSDEYTGFYGQLFARGGADGGNGGFVETSSLGNLQAVGWVTTSAEIGAGGTWLLDPLDVTIANSGSNLPASNAFTPTVVNSQVSNTSINSALNNGGAGGTVTIMTAGSATTASGGLVDQDGNITVAAPLSDSDSGGNLIFIANNDITISSTINLTGDLTFTLPGSLVISRKVSVDNIIMNEYAPAADIAISAQVTTTGNMKFLLAGGFNLSTDSNLTVGGNLDVVSSAGAIQLLSNISSVGGALSFTGGTNFQANGTLGGASIYIRANNGGLTLNNSINSSDGNINLQTGSGTITLNNTVTATGGRIEVTADTGDVNVNNNLTSGANENVSVTANNGNVRVGQNATLRSSNDNGGVFVTGQNGVNLAGILQSFTREISVTAKNGAITRNDAGNRRIQVGTGNLAMEGRNGVNAQINLNDQATVRAYADAGDVVIDSRGSNLTINADAANNISITAENNLTITRRDDRNFDGADVSLTTGNNGNIILGGNNIVATGTFSASPGGTGVILFASSRVGDEVSAPTQNYNGPVEINSAAELFGNTAINFNGTVTLDKNLVLLGNANATFNADVQGTGTGSPGGLYFLDDDNQTGVVRLNAFAGTEVLPIAEFVKEGGTIEFAGGGGLLTPAINLVPGGRLLLLSTILSLASDTYLASGGDFVQGNTVNSFNDSAAVGFRFTTPGQFILNGAVGQTFALRTFQLDTSAGDGDIVINAPVNVRPMELAGGGQTFDPKNNGTITLKAGANLVVEGNLRTEVFNVTTGAIQLSAGGEAQENIQLGNVNLQTRGGTITFGTASGNSDGDVFFTGAATVDSFADNAGGEITFHGLVDGSARASILAGTAKVDFNGAVGDISPLGMDVQSAGGVNFNSTVLFGAASSITSLSGNVVFGNSLDVLGNSALNLDVGNNNLDFKAVGTGNPLGSLTVSTGKGRVTLGGNITTAGGAVSLGPDVRVAENVTINTTALNSGNGANIVFRKSVDADTEAGGGRSLKLNAGAAGNIQFGSGTSTSVGSRLGSLSVDGGAPEIVGAGGGFSMLGTVAALGGIDINATLNPLINGGPVLLKSISGDILLRQGILGQSNTTQGSDVSLTAEQGEVRVNGNITLNGSSNLLNTPGLRGGNLIVLAKSAVFQDVVSLGGGDNEPLAPGAAQGGNVSITATFGNLTIGNITTKGGAQGVRGPGGQGGNILLDASGTIVTGYLDSSGGTTQDGVGGNAGDITITTGSDFRIPVGFLAIGGDGTGASAAFAGRGGTVTITTDAADADIAFSANSLNLQADMNLLVRSAGNIVFGRVADFANPLTVESGVVLTSNVLVGQNGERTPSLLLNRGRAIFEFGGTDRDAQFLMPSSSSILSNGGLVAINRVNGMAPGSATDGLITISGNISTSTVGQAGGQVAINTSLPGLTPVTEYGAVLVNSAIDTRGGEPASGNTAAQFGRNGGAVTVVGTQITVHEITTQGSASATTATVPAFGGAGGNISLTADSTITLRRNLDSSGGAGQGTKNAQGGGGGSITLSGNVVLDSGRGDLTTLVLNSQGGTLAGSGANGVGGEINLPGTLTGTKTTSNTLDLRYGSGTATLGGAVTLGNLITAADDARSTGTVIVAGRLTLDTLTTFARGYNIQIRGDVPGQSSVASAVNFLNTGTVTLGAAGQKLTFTGGFDTLTGSTVGAVNLLPAQTFLAGELVTGSASNPGSGAGMTTGVTVLAANTFLNSNGNAIEIGQLDGTTAGVQGLTLRAGIGAGSVAFNTSVGMNVRLGDFLIEGASTNPKPTEQATTSVFFKQDLFANNLTGGLHSAVNFEGNSDLQGTTTLAGTTVLNNGTAGEELVFRTGAGGTSTFGVIQLKGAEDGLGIRFDAANALELTQAVTGSVHLVLDGAGSKLFAATVGSAATPVGNGLAGIDQVNSSGVVTFQGDVFTSGASTFEGSVALGGITYTSADRVVFGGDSLDTVTLNEGTVTLAGTGEKAFQGAVVSSLADLVVLAQALGTGKVVFGDSVTSTGSDGSFNLAGDVEFAGTSFSSAGQVNLSKTVLLRDGTVTLTGNGDYSVSASVNGARNLVLDGSGNKVFTGELGGITAIGTGTDEAIKILGNGVTTLGAVRAASGIISSSNAALVLNGNVRILGSGDTDSNFAGTVQLAGVSFTSDLGVLFGNSVTLSGGTTTLAGNGLEYRFLGNLGGTSPGSQSLAYTSSADLTFLGNVGSGVLRLAGLTQSAAAGDMKFQGNVSTAGNSFLNGKVILDGGQFDTSAGGVTRFNNIQLSGVTVKLSGNGSHVVTGQLTGTGTDLDVGVVGNTGNATFSAIENLGKLTIQSAGTTTLGGLTTATSIEQNAGTASLRANVTTAGDVEMKGTTQVVGSVTVDSSAAMQKYATMNLAGNFTAKTTKDSVAAVTFGTGGVGGTGNIILDTSASGARVQVDGTIANVGTFEASRSGSISLNDGGYLGSAGVARIRSSGGAMFTSTGGNVSAEAVTANTALTLRSITGAASLNNVVGNVGLTLSGATTAAATDVTGSNLNLTGGTGATVGALGLSGLLSMNSSGILGILSSSAAGNLDLSGVSVSGLNFLSTPLINNVTLTGGGLAYAPSGNLGVTGRVNTSGDIALTPGGTLNSSGSLTTGGGVLLTAGNNMAVTGPVRAQTVRMAPAGNLGVTGRVNTSGDIALTPGGTLNSSGSLTTGGGVLMTAGNNMAVTGPVRAQTVRMAPAGNLVTAGNNFSSPDIRALTRDFFNTFPANAGIVGTRLVVGATSLSQLGPNEIGVAQPLLAGAGAPYITEFTTGTGQPYILATQNAVPGVMMPATLSTAGAFGSRTVYTQDEMEMMTPQERSAFEASRRQQAARVILQRGGGEEQEIGTPVEGEIPQAKAPEADQPAPTAQVFLGGKPLAGKSEKEKSDSTQLLKLRSSRAIALRPELDAQKILENERLAAEVNLEAAPVVTR